MLQVLLLVAGQVGFPAQLVVNGVGVGVFCFGVDFCGWRCVWVRGSGDGWEVGKESGLLREDCGTLCCRSAQGVRVKY